MNVPLPAGRAGLPPFRSRPVTAVLGPTNTGKTHLAIERMMGHTSGIIGLPLRLLAREVYNRIVDKVGPAQVALITGEEKIKPERPRYWVSTVEAMPRDLDVDFVAVDEIQVAADLDRGHVFTNRLLNRRGREETMMIGAETIRPLIERLIPDAVIVSRPRLSNLTFAGERKISRLARRSAIVAFSAEEVYAIAEFIRRHKGGAAVVLGALSPRTRNAQVAMYQNGEVDYIVATDAIGMGLNLDVDHIAFAGDRKFDGWQYRRLNPSEFAQIAGRAGRHTNDGTFGTTGRCAPFDPELVEALENHRFDALTTLQWRNSELDFAHIGALQASLEREPPAQGLTRAPLGEDVLVLDVLSRDETVRKSAATRKDVERLWDACQIPDYRKLSPAAHAELVLTIYGFIVRAGKVPEDWFQRHLSTFDRTDGEIDTLSARIAQIRTFNFIANRPDWLKDPEHWQGITRQVEDRLSDALHERLAHRFVDRRTSVLMRRLRENAMLEAEVTTSGDVLVEGQHVGSLQGFRFTADPMAEGEVQKTLNAAAQKALASEIDGRATRVGDAVDDAFVLANDGTLRWLGEVVGKIAAGDHILKPVVRVLADERLSGASLETVQRRLDLWLAQHVKKLLGPLFELEAGEGLEGIGRGIAFQVAESLGVLERQRAAAEIKNLDQAGRGSLRKLGLRFGAYHIYLPQLLKPAPRSLAAQLWALKHGGLETMKGLDEVAHLASSGRTSFAVDKDVSKGLYLAAGFRASGDRAVRVDILERLADLVRPAIAYRPGATAGDPPAGTADGDGFIVTVAMTSLAGCSGETFASILRSLGYHSQQRKGPAITVPLVPKAATEPVKPVQAAAETDAATEAAAVSEDAPAAADVSAEAPAVEAVSETVEAAPVEAVVEAPEPVADVVAEAESEAVPQAEVAEQGEVAVVASPEVATADASVETAETAPDVVAEDPMIEVWTPHRRHEPRKFDFTQRRPGRNEGRNEGRGEGRNRGPRPQGRSDGQTGTPEAGVAAAPVDGAEAPAQQQRRDGGRDRFKKKFEGRGGQKPGEGRRDRPDQQRPQNQRFERPKPKERQPDPNSPFAKLAALKEQLENKDRSR
ncbi:MULTISPECIES: helicase-related protein [unclassified Beijerinckia]|uniref:helicase-related protein n=1 Tax=unclassified Beijerinckia TaxID=2638183 RepID=UPI00089D4BDB|nr:MULTISPECIES: helicase-related protein [unclassified Beijerinckia]MDH7798147.1 ATP-dependent RNA helicase SUPV3L1/SUV3 [Beijerinckia sp. GAS462]SED10701.1 ATP-dependent RNA helicase SUPV3L1/SUV3 [Beijerinckia sp. 28-YEA-48]